MALHDVAGNPSETAVPPVHLVAVENAPGQKPKDVPDIRGYQVLNQAGLPVAAVKTLLVNPGSGETRAAILTNLQNQRFAVPLDLLALDPNTRQVLALFPARRLEHVPRQEA